ncbi:hypothetical protein TrVE_jg9940 [Triparma verrucosa]|uniref:Alpha-ketoglutarate-dependent dioxygenase AlkB-like domain-containing protein n=1 Tax=Triparma verrucosa TaxID=1606542 RepID=A0A9W7BVC5_9STRA|nr:hypothetical protein TrVE_jg9940 [Triparma verrucosa]
MFEKEILKIQGREKHYRNLNKLAWATQGYNYDWTLRKYHEGRRSPFPNALAKLAQSFSSLSNSGPFTPQASIVNFYNSKSLMGGHQDDLELTFTKPVISLSMGLPCIFLLGGLDKSEPPCPILVRNGDVMIMGGESRLRFHGMCRVLVHGSEGEMVSLPPVDEDLICQEDKQIKELEEEEVPGQEMESEEREGVEEFLKTHRINVNVRQVLPDGQESI